MQDLAAAAVKAAGAVARAEFLGPVSIAAHHQGLGLGNCVDDQALVMLAQIFAAVAQSNEFHGNHILALVQHLKESMLPIGAWFAPDDGAEGTARGCPSLVTRLPLLSISSCCR